MTTNKQPWDGRDRMRTARLFLLFIGLSIALILLTLLEGLGRLIHHLMY